MKTMFELMEYNGTEWYKFIFDYLILLKMDRMEEDDEMHFISFHHFLYPQI